MYQYEPKVYASLLGDKSKGGGHQPNWRSEALKDTSQLRRTYILTKKYQQKEKDQEKEREQHQGKRAEEEGKRKRKKQKQSFSLKAKKHHQETYHSR